MGVGGEQQVLVGGEGERVGCGAGADAGDAAVYPSSMLQTLTESAAEVGDPEGAVVGADDAVDRLVADGIGAFDFVGPGLDLGEGVRSRSWSRISRRRRA